LAIDQNPLSLCYQPIPKASRTPRKKLFVSGLSGVHFCTLARLRHVLSCLRQTSIDTHSPPALTKIRNPAGSLGCDLFCLSARPDIRLQITTPFPTFAPHFFARAGRAPHCFGSSALKHTCTLTACLRFHQGRFIFTVTTLGFKVRKAKWTNALSASRHSVLSRPLITPCTLSCLGTRATDLSFPHFFPLLVVGNVSHVFRCEIVFPCSPQPLSTK